MKRERGKHFGYTVAPFTIVRDHREGLPYTFTDIRSDHFAGGVVMEVTVTEKQLATGDYTIAGFEDRVAVERKSVADAVSTWTAGRKRWECELDRLSCFSAPLVLIEGGWNRIAELIDMEARDISLRALVGSVISWQQAFLGVHWMFAPDRRFAEIYAFRWLERYWKKIPRSSPL